MVYNIVLFKGCDGAWQCTIVQLIVDIVERTSTKRMCVGEHTYL